jgi:hypothetical protein
LPCEPLLPPKKLQDHARSHRHAIHDVLVTYLGAVFTYDRSSPAAGAPSGAVVNEKNGCPIRIPG